MACLNARRQVFSSGRRSEEGSGLGLGLGLGYLQVLKTFSSGRRAEEAEGDNQGAEKAASGK